MTGLMAGKRGLIMGLANDRSLAWGIAKQLGEHGAELAFSYQGEALEKRVRPLAESLGSDFLVDCDVGDMDALGIRGKDATPYLLGRIVEITDGESLTANIALVEHNARLGAAIAGAYAGR